MAVLEGEDIAISEKWRNVFFSTPDGKDILEEMLLQMHTFDSLPLDDPAAIALRNYGVWMLFRLGVYQDNNVKSIIDKLASIPYKESI